MKSLATRASGATSVNVNVYKQKNESISTMRKRFASVKNAIQAANPGVKVTVKYRSTSTLKACASQSNRCAVVIFNR